LNQLKESIVLQVLVICLLLLSQLFALETHYTTPFKNILPHAKIYIDTNSSYTIKSIQNQTFASITQEQLSFGYSPNFSVWIKFKLENPSDQSIDKIIEYANPLTTDVIFFDPQSNHTLHEGLIHKAKDRVSINPIFHITLPPHSSKTFYIKAHSTITTMIIKLYLWSPKSFYQEEFKHQFILALFFGAMGIIILYNFLIFLGTREISYLYYILFFIGITIHHLLYSGVAIIYLAQNLVAHAIEYSAFIVALPALFLALFIQNILELHRYPRLNRLLKGYLILFPLLVIVFHWQEWHQYRNLFSIIMLFLLLSIILYTLFKRERQAYYLAIGWFLFISSGAFMYLSSLGIFDLFNYLPYYGEFALFIESLLFSMILAHKIKQLHGDKITLQNNLIHYQKEEQQKLTNLVNIKTQELQYSLQEKELLLKEFNHRLKNSIATIVAFLRMQVDEIEEPRIRSILINFENRILSISHLYTLLYHENSMHLVNSHEFFTLLIDDIEQSYNMPHITIDIESQLDIPSQYAIYCGFILNEAITNALQHAFVDRNEGRIVVSLNKIDEYYYLKICDNGIGYQSKSSHESLGMSIIETLVRTQLHGKLKIKANKGVEIEIVWRDEKD